MPVYDDQKTEPTLDDLERDFAADSAKTSGSDIARQKEIDELNSKFGDPSAPESGSQKLADDESASGNGPNDTLGKGFTGSKKSKSSIVGGLLKNKSKAATITAIVGGVTGLAAFGGFFGFLGIFSLDNFLSNIEDKAFVRYQVNMEGRSSKWINAYLTIRLADIDDETGKPVSGSKWRDDDNLYFRSNRVDNNNPLYDWYRTMRTSSFEQDVFEKYGIRFTSVAYRDGASIDFRKSAVITINQEAPLKGDITDDDIRVMERIAAGNGGQSDIDRLNSKLGRFIDVDVMENDKVARKAIRDAVNKEVNAWQWMKRRHIRKDIQNMTGVRSWRFFENTRNTADQKLIDMKNNFLLAALPDDIKAGRFMLCLFGVNECSVSTDPGANNKNPTPDVNSPKEGGSSYPDAEDGTPGTRVDSGETGDIAQASAREGIQEATEKSALLTRRIMVQIASKINGAAGIAAIIDALSRIDELISKGGLTAMVVAAKTQQTIGFYTTLAIARDQMRTSELTSTEYDNFMTMIDGVGNNQIWSEVNDPGSTNDISATQQCSDESLAQLKASDYTPLCEQYRIGSETNAEKIERWWNDGLGNVLSPVFAAWRSTLGIVVSAANEFMDGIFKALKLDEAFSAILRATGLEDNVQSAIAWVTNQAAKGLGAGPMVDDPTGPQIGLLAAEGAAATNEASMRYQGASASTVLSRSSNSVLAAQYFEDRTNSQSLYDRYISLDNYDSFAVRQLGQLANSSTFDSASNLLTGLIQSVASLPNALFSRVGAADFSTQTGYEIADMAGIQTYDFPSQCTNADIFNMTPTSATNADELGIIPSSELTWDLVNNKDSFYARLYQNDISTNEANQVYNCALLETSVRGAIGAQYGYEDDNSIYATPETSVTNETPSTSTGTGNLGDKAYLQSSSIEVACDARTEDLGIHTGYANKKPVQIRLCAIPQLISTDAESTVGSPYYIDGAKGHAIVNANISSNMMNMITSMDASSSVSSLSATSTFRSHARQIDLRNSLGDVAAVPGTSNHEMGLAIDFRIAPPGQQNKNNCAYVSGVCTARLDPYGVYDWLVTNANSYGFSQFSREFWHWEAIGVGGF